MHFAESAMRRIAEAEEPRTTIVFRLLRKTPLHRNVLRERSFANNDPPSPEHFTSRGGSLSLQCSKNGKVLPLSYAETSLFLGGVPNSCK